VTRWPAILANLLLFDALWTLAVLGAGRPWWWAAPALILISTTIQLRSSPAPLREAAVIFLGALAGLSLDAAARALGLFRYASGSTPEFLIVFLALWINFGTTLRPSLRWLWPRPALAALLAAASAPLAYWLASRLGAISPQPPPWRALAWSAGQYALALPLWMLLASRLLTAAPAPVPPPSGSAAPPPPGTPSS
jgi:hypothetical protein